MTDRSQTRWLPGAVCAVLAVIHSTARAGPSDRPALAAEQMQEDLQYLRDTWAQKDKSFSSENRAVFKTVVNATLARTHELTPAEFSLEVARAVALSGNGHTNADLGPYLHALPFKAVWFEEGLYVVRTHPAYRELLGARVDRFGGLSAEDCLKRLIPYLSGTPEHIRALSPGYLRQLEILRQLGATAAVDQVELRFTLADGRKKVMTMSEEPSSDPEGLPPYQQLIRLESDGDPPGRWPHVLDGIASIPTAFQRRMDLTSEWIGEGHETFYIKSDQVRQPPLGTRDPFEVILQWKPRTVVLDLRFNSGGDFTKSVQFCEALPRVLPKAKIFVLVGPGTFSAALVTAALLKANGGDRVVLVGETMGDRPQFWAEGAQLELPNSHISVSFATAYEDWSNGCDDISRCFWLNVVYGRKHVSLRPEIHVTTSFKDYRVGRDQVLEAAVRAAHARR